MHTTHTTHTATAQHLTSTSCHAFPRVSRISQVTELRLNPEGRVVEGWVRRQLTLEERAAPLKHPDKHPAPKPIDWERLLRSGEQQVSGGQADGARSKRLAAMDAWIQVCCCVVGVFICDVWCWHCVQQLYGHGPWRSARPCSGTT